MTNHSGLAERTSAPGTGLGTRDRTVEAQRRFLAYAAHELRGSITLPRALAEVTLADADAGAAALRDMGERVVAACARQERLLEALLTLSRSERGGLRREPVDLASTADEALRANDQHGLTITTSLELARTTGDPQLVERLVANLVGNAVAHNVQGGQLDIATHTATGRAVFAISNTGALIPARELPRLFQPFQRHGSPAGGVGLGLAIVQAIAEAHDARITAHARPHGGLAIQVAFPSLD
jgi:signal transduction histidine kinase